MLNRTKMLCSVCRSVHTMGNLGRKFKTPSSLINRSRNFHLHSTGSSSAHTCQIQISKLNFSHDWTFKRCVHTSGNIRQTDSTEKSQDDSRGTYDAEEVAKFHSFAGSWWDERGDAAALHTMNHLRVPFVKDGILQTTGGTDVTPQPLEGMTILDVGCGGGVLSEALARLGASVTGIDALSDSIKVAQWHAEHDPSVASRVSYRCCLAEELVASHAEQFDAVVASEVIEHVGQPPHFVTSCCQLVKPGGSLFFTTINKTPLSYALAVVAAEYIFHIVPTGTHDWNKFIPPEELQSMLQSNGAQVQTVHGMTLNPMTLRWSWMRDTSINYALHAVKAAN